MKADKSSQNDFAVANTRNSFLETDGRTNAIRWKGEQIDFL